MNPFAGWEGFSWWGTPAEWLGVAEGIALTLLAQWAFRRKPRKPSKKEGGEGQ